jgi:DinB superfamily
MNKRGTPIIAELKKNLEDSIVFFSSLSSDQLRMQVYQDGARWTVQQVLAHFITIERSMQWLFKNILAGGAGAPQDFDLERFNRSQPKKLDRKSVDELIAQFTAVREDTISIVHAMSDADFDRKGRHAFHGFGKLERFIRWTYEHVCIHIDEIRKALQI